MISYTSGIWSKLSSPGSIYDDDIQFEKLLTDKGSIFDITQAYTGRHIRCNGCKEPCSGGSRIVAAACNLVGTVGTTESEASIATLLSAMTSKDPACPLYRINEESEEDEF